MVIHRIEIMEGDVYRYTYVYIFTVVGTVRFLLFPLPYLYTWNNVVSEEKNNLQVFLFTTPLFNIKLIF